MKLTQQKLFWSTNLFSGLLLCVITIFLGLTYNQTGQWPALALAGITGTVVLAYGVAAWVVFTQKRLQTGLGLVMAVQIMGVMLAPLFVADFWLIGLIIMATVPLKTGIAGKLQQMPRFVILALLAASLMIGLDLLALPNRLLILTTLPQTHYLVIVTGGVLYLAGLIFLLWFVRLRPQACCYVRPNLTTQLSLLVTAILALSILVITGVLIVQIHDIQIKKVGQTFQTTAEVEAERVGNILERQIIDLANLGQSPDILNRVEEVWAGYPGNDKTLIRSYLWTQENRWRHAAENDEFVLQYRTGPAVMALTAFRGSHNSHKNLFVTDQVGGLVAAHGEKPEKLFYGDDDWWQTVWDLTQDGVYLGRLTHDPATQKVSIFMAVRIVSPKTYQPIEALASTYDLQSIQQIIALANENASHKVRLLAADGVVLAGPTKTEIGQPAPPLFKDILSAQADRAGPPSGWLLEKPGQTVLAYSRLNSTSQSNLDRIRSLGWTVLVSDSQAHALAEVNRSTEIATLVALLALAGIIIVANTMAKIITRPVEDLTATAREINEGNLDAQARPAGPQELVTLAETFNSLTANLNTYITNLRQSEKKYRALFEDSKDAIYLTDPTGHIIDVNPAGLSLFGYTEAETQRGNVFHVYANPDDRLRFQQEMELHGSVKDFEVKLRRKDNAEIDGLVTATLRQAEDGTILGYQGIIRDITAQKQAEKERLQLSAIQRELDMARNIQVSLLPPPQPVWGGPDVVCYSKPAQEVGGDFYAYHALDDKPLAGGKTAGGFALVVGDISGKGMPAALLMAVSLASVQTVINQSFSPGELLAHLDRVLAHYTQTTRQNCALCYVEFKPAGNGQPGRILHAANAGGVLPIIRRGNGAVEWVEVGGLPLGVGLGAESGYQEVTLPLAPGDLVILTSDGVIEAMNQTGEIFGFERLEQAVAAGPALSAETMLGHLKRQVTAFVGPTEPHDDLTLVVVRV
ncbi:MAG: SpoIIE family protein phosphatase [Anaerolineae bacterium]|nr:SpoIIE family protein phosphatase [Anaerolineae bacterium]